MKKFRLFFLFGLIFCLWPFTAKAYTVKTMPIDYEFMEYIKNNGFLGRIDRDFKEDEIRLGTPFVIQSNIGGINVVVARMFDNEVLNCFTFSEYIHDDGLLHYSSGGPADALNNPEDAQTLAFYGYDSNTYVVRDDTELSVHSVYNHPANATLEEILAVMEPYTFEVDIFHTRNNMREVLDAYPVWFKIMLEDNILDAKALRTEEGLYVPAGVFSQFSGKVRTQWDPYKKSVCLFFDESLSASVAAKEYMGTDCIVYYRNGLVDKLAAQPLLNLDGRAMIPYDACSFIWLQAVEDGVVWYRLPQG